MIEDIRNMIDKVKNFKQFVNENVENLTILYHGTSDDKDVIDRDYMFLSTSPTFAKEYGDKILQVKVNVGRVFNTLLLSDICFKISVTGYEYFSLSSNAICTEHGKFPSNNSSHSIELPKNNTYSLYRAIQNRVV